MVEAKEGVVFHTGLPQVFTRPVADHVEANQVLHGVILQPQQTHASIKRGTKPNLTP